MSTALFINGIMCICMMCISSNCIMRILCALKRKTSFVEASA